MPKGERAMTDRFTEAAKEQQDKSPFVCISCGHPKDIANIKEQAAKAGASLHDRFSEAVEESGEKSAFVCESCGHEQPMQN